VDQPKSAARIALVYLACNAACVWIPATKATSVANCYTLAAKAVAMLPSHPSPANFLFKSGT
jgi:hypothetical protein